MNQSPGMIAVLTVHSGASEDFVFPSVGPLFCSPFVGLVVRFVSTSSNYISLTHYFSQDLVQAFEYRKHRPVCKRYRVFKVRAQQDEESAVMWTVSALPATSSKLRYHLQQKQRTPKYPVIRGGAARQNPSTRP